MERWRDTHAQTEKDETGDWRAQLDKKKWLWKGIKCKKKKEKKGCVGEKSGWD